MAWSQAKLRTRRRVCPVTVLGRLEGSQGYQTVFTCSPPAVRSCLATPLSVGAATDTLYVELYGTGIRGAASVQCFVAGQSVPVFYAGQVAAYPGLDQVDISIPKSLAGSGDVRVYVVADGVFSNVVGLKIQ